MNDSIRLLTRAAITRGLAQSGWSHSHNTGSISTTMFDCPVPACDYKHESANGIIGHVGNGHPDGWEETDVTARDIHRKATEHDEAAMRRVMRVEDYLARQGVDVGSVCVYEHQAWGSIQIAPLDELDDYKTFLVAVREPEGIRYDGDVNYCTDEFVAGLPAELEKTTEEVMSNDTECP